MSRLWLWLGHTTGPCRRGHLALVGPFYYIFKIVRRAQGQVTAAAGACGHTSSVGASSWRSQLGLLSLSIPAFSLTQWWMGQWPRHSGWLWSWGGGASIYFRPGRFTKFLPSGYILHSNKTCALLLPFFPQLGTADANHSISSAIDPELSFRVPLSATKFSPFLTHVIVKYCSVSFMRAYIFWTFTYITVNIQVFRQKSPQGRRPSLVPSRRYTYIVYTVPMLAEWIITSDVTATELAGTECSNFALRKVCFFTRIASDYERFCYFDE